MKTFKAFKIDVKMDKYVSDEIKKRKLAKFPVNATDDIKMRMKPNKPAFKFPTPTGSMMIHVFLRPMKGKKGMMAFNYQLEDIKEDMCDLKKSDLKSGSMKSAWDKKCSTSSGSKKKNTNISKIARKVGAGTTYNEYDPTI